MKSKHNSENFFITDVDIDDDESEEHKPKFQA